MKIVINSGLVLPVFAKRSELIKQMQSLGLHVSISGYQTEGKDECIRQGCGFSHIRMSRSGLNPIADMRTILDYYRTYKSERFDVVHSYTVKPNIYGSIAARMARVKQIYPTVNGLGYTFTDMSTKGKIVRGVTCALYRIAFSCATKVIFQNKDDMEELVRRHVVNKSKCTVVAGSGINLNEYPYTEQSEGIVFLLASRLLIAKGVREYIEAARLVKKEYPESVFQLAGGLDSSPNSISQQELDDCVKDGSIEYLGKVDDMYSALAACNVFVLPSYYREGVPHAVLEAMSVGRAVITTDVPGCRETVNGKNGILIQPRDSKQLAEAMLWMVRNPEEVIRMGTVGREYAASRFDVKLVNSDILRIMNLDS